MPRYGSRWIERLRGRAPAAMRLRGCGMPGIDAAHVAQSGFTLIEVLVALAILGISLAVLLSIFLQGLDRAHESRSESEARVLAQSLLSQARSTANPAIGTSAGKSAGMLWRLQVVPYGTPADRAAWQESAAQIVATVSWRGDGGMRSISLSTLRLLPKAESGNE